MARSPRHGTRAERMFRHPVIRPPCRVAVFWLAVWMAPLLAGDSYDLAFSTFLGGSGNDNGRAGCVAADGSLIVAGATSGDGWPTRNAFQKGPKGKGDAMVAKLARRR